MTLSYQWPLVAFSVLIAILASYTTLRLAFRLAWASRATRRWWVAGGALAMGIGIWAMHFVGMLALVLPVPVAYDPALTAFSVLPAVLTAAVALSMLARHGADARARLAAPMLMGLGIVTMHYGGMAAMRMSPPIVYDPWLFTLSVLIAVGASGAALHLAFREHQGSGMPFARRLAGAVLMGLAIAGMHYTGMAAASFAPDAVCTVAASGLGGNAIALFVGLAAVLVLAASLALTFFDEVLGENTFYRALLAAQSDAGEGVLVIEADRVVYANRAMQAMSGYSEAELKALPNWTAMVEGCALELKPMADPGAFMQASPGRQEIVLRDRAGRMRSCEVVLSGFRHADATRHLLVCIDVSERKSAEAALRQRDAQARELALVASATDNAVIIMNADALITWVNAGFTRMSGYSLEEAIGRHPRDLLSGPDMDPVTVAYIEEKVARGERFEMEVAHYHKNGRPYWVVIDLQAVRDDAGVVVKYISIERDITRRKASEVALRQLNETLEQRVLQRTEELDRQRAFIETILETAETLIFVLDGEGRFVRFNRACERLTGYGFEELRGQPIWEFVITPERRREVRLKHENQRDPSGFPPQLEVEWLTKDGRRRLLAWSNAVITDGRGKMEYLIGTGIDITERKRAEQALIVANQSLGKSIEHLRQTQSQLVQAEKMASLGVLVAGISHEINTPLGIGVTSATALQEELLALQRAFQAGSMKRSTLERYIAHGLEGVDILVSNLMRAAELIRGFKQVAVDQSSGEQREIDVAQYVDEVVLSLQPRLRGRRIQVINASEPGVRIRTHPGAIYQILGNLLINALVHAYEPEQQGKIRIEARRENDEVVLDFSDDGKGIAPEHQDRIFDPFFTTRRGPGGSGLGLHIVFNLVVSTLQGSIRLVANAPKGTMFRITFPPAPAPQQEQG